MERWKWTTHPPGTSGTSGAAFGVDQAACAYPAVRGLGMKETCDTFCWHLFAPWRVWRLCTSWKRLCCTCRCFRACYWAKAFSFKAFAAAAGDRWWHIAAKQTWQSDVPFFSNAQAVEVSSVPKQHRDPGVVCTSLLSFLPHEWPSDIYCRCGILVDFERLAKRLPSQRWRGGTRRDAGSHVQEWHYHSLQYPPISTLPMGFRAAKSHAIWPVQLGEDLEHLAELARWIQGAATLPVLYYRIYRIWFLCKHIHHISTIMPADRCK